MSSGAVAPRLAARLAHRARRRLAAGLAAARLLADHAQEGLLVRGAQELRRRLVELGDLDRHETVTRVVFAVRGGRELTRLGHAPLAEADVARTGDRVIAKVEHRDRIGVPC